MLDRHLVILEAIEEALVGLQLLLGIDSGAFLRRLSAVLSFEFLLSFAVVFTLGSDLIAFSLLIFLFVALILALSLSILLLHGGIRARLLGLFNCSSLNFDLFYRWLIRHRLSGRCLLLLFVSVLFSHI